MPPAVPNTPLGLFVKRNYAPGLRKGVFKKLSTKGFVPPAARGAPDAPGGGGTVDTRSTGGTTRAQRRQLPAELIGTPGVRGPYARTPRLNPTEWLFTPNRFGSLFASPITETTGLMPQQLADLRAYDAEGVAQQGQISSSYAALGTQLGAEAEAQKARLASLGSLIQASPTYQGGAVPGSPDEQLASARRAELGAGAAVSVGQAGLGPQLAASEGQRFLQEFLGARSSGRRELIGGYREQNQAAAAAGLEAQAAERETAAQLRGQDLQLLGTQISQAGGLERALVGAQSREATSAATLQTRLQIAQMQGDVSTANNIRSQLARLQAAELSAAGKPKKLAPGKPGTAQYQTNRRTFVNNLQSTFYDDEGNVKAGASTEGAVRRGINLGLRPTHVIQALRSLDPTYGRDRGDAREILGVLADSGMSLRRAWAIVRQLTGINLDERVGA